MLTGSDFIVCQSNGRWSELRTTCQSFCRFPGGIEHGETTTAPREYYLVGEKVVYYCTEPGYKLNADNVLECMEGSVWSKKAPGCVMHNAEQ